MRYSRIVFACAGLMILACAGLMIAGCLWQPAVPTFPATIRITAQLHSIREMRIESIDYIEVPLEHIPQVLKIVTPVTFIEDGIRPELNYHGADVYLHHQDSSVTKIEVRFTGHNPAAVTVDGSNYFYASVDGPVDGASALAVLLADLHFETQQAGSEIGLKGD